VQVVANLLDADIPTPFAQTATLVRRQTDSLEEKLKFCAARAAESFCKGKAIHQFKTNKRRRKK
jgi:hypothetical protein